MEHLKKDFKPFEWRGISFDKQTVFALASAFGTDKVFHDKY